MTSRQFSSYWGVFFLFFTFSSSLTAYASLDFRFKAHGAESHGGNPNPQALFRDARARAASLLDQIGQMNDADLGKDLDPQVRKWILGHRTSWSEDIQNSPHQWPASEKEDADNLLTLPPHLKNRAAYTACVPAAPITFSYSVCVERVRTSEQAVQVLLHESCHHLGLKDEAFIDTIVDAVYGFWERQRGPDETILGLIEGSTEPALFPANAAPLCASLAFAVDKMNCLRAIKFGMFEDEALAFCHNLRYGVDKITCLKTVRDKLFDHSRLRECREKASPQEVIACLKKCAVDAEPLTFAGEVRTTGWVKLSARNYDVPADAWRAIDEQASLVCEGWKTTEWAEKDWHLRSCYRSHDAVGTGSRSLPFEKVTDQHGSPAAVHEYYYHCTVRVRCADPTTTQPTEKPPKP